MTGFRPAYWECCHHLVPENHDAFPTWAVDIKSGTVLVGQMSPSCTVALMIFYNHTCFCLHHSLVSRVSRIQKSWYGYFLKWRYPSIIHVVGFSIINHPFWDTPMYGKPISPQHGHHRLDFGRMCRLWTLPAQSFAHQLPVSAVQRHGPKKTGTLSKRIRMAFTKAKDVSPDYMGGFLKWGTPKSSILVILVGFSLINQPFWGSPFVLCKSTRLQDAVLAIGPAVKIAAQPCHHVVSIPFMGTIKFPTFFLMFNRFFMSHSYNRYSIDVVIQRDSSIFPSSRSGRTVKDKMSPSWKVLMPSWRLLCEGLARGLQPPVFA